MSNHVHWVIEVNINDGQLDAFKSLMEEMVTATQADEPGALNYEWFFSADETQCHIYERYADSAATMVHLGNFGTKFAGRFMESVTPTRLVIYGSPSEDVRQAMAPLGAVHMEQQAGFAR